MANQFVKPYIETLEFAFGLYRRFLAVCGSDAWNEKFGGWPIGQQYYHALATSGQIFASITGEEVANPLPEAGNLERQEKAPDKEKAAQLLENLQLAAVKILHTLTNEDLPKKNEPLSQKFGRDITVAGTLELIACHIMYHLGACDADLRQRGEEPAFR